MAAAAHIQEGAIVAGRFRLEHELGRGGMGSVWAAHHLTLGVPCAVKFILDAELAADGAAARRFQREAQAAARLRGSHVVQVLDSGIWRGQPYIAMERLEGETLRDRLDRRGRLAGGETLAIIGGVARALMGARALGIVHRDLKPENVFLVREDGEEVAKVLDFGLAKLSDGESVYQTRAGALLGTPHYMSPEQVDGTVALDHRADLWSLAVIVFECLTGELPFDGETLWRLLSHITLGQPPVASRLVAELPPALDGWLARALARDPRSRFDSAQAFYHALEQALREGPPVRTLVAPIEDAPTERVDEDDTLHGHTSRPAVARPAGARGVAALVLAALVFGGAFLALQLRAPGLRHASGALAAPANSVGRALAAPAARVADIAPAAKSSASSLAGTPPAAPLPAPSAPRTAPSHLHPRRMD